MKCENNKYFTIHELTKICSKGDDKSFKKKTLEVILSLGYDIDKFKGKNKNSPYQLPPFEAAAMIVMYLSNGRTKNSLISKIVNERYKEISSREINKFLYIVSKVKDIITSDLNLADMSDEIDKIVNGRDECKKGEECRTCDERNTCIIYHDYSHIIYNIDSLDETTMFNNIFFLSNNIRENVYEHLDEFYNMLFIRQGYKNRDFASLLEALRLI